MVNSGKGHAVVEALMADTPIINLDIGADFVVHFLDGPEWDGTRDFRLSSPLAIQPKSTNQSGRFRAASLIQIHWRSRSLAPGDKEVIDS